MNRGRWKVRRPGDYDYDPIEDFNTYVHPGLEKKSALVEWGVSVSSNWLKSGPEYLKRSPTFQLSNSDEECVVVLRRSANNRTSVYLNMIDMQSSISGTFGGDIMHMQGKQSVRLDEMLLSKDTYSAGLGWGFKDILPNKPGNMIDLCSFVSAPALLWDPGNSHPQSKLCEHVFIILEVTLTADSSCNAKNEHVANEEISMLSEHLDSLYKNGKFSDISLVVKGESLRAHKAILSARSPVLAAMLDCDMTENRTNEIEIEDLDVDVVKEMLRFMYTGQVESLEEVAYGLLIAADKYGVDSLKVKCAASLASNLSVQNVAQIFRLAGLHSDDQLHKTAADFIKKNMAAVSKTEGWKLLKKSSPELVINTFIEI